MRTRQSLSPITALYDEASGIYRQAFRELVAVAGMVALAFNLVLFLNPSLLILHISWGVLVNLLAVTMLASTMLVPMIQKLGNEHGETQHSLLAGIRLHGRTVALATMVMTLVIIIM